MKISIIGCGVIGNKRAKALGDHALLACADANLSRAQAVSVQHPGCIATADWRLAATREDVDAVIVSTTNDVLAAAALAKVVVKVGFNHRFHPALQKAREIIDAGTLGPVMFLRARYGHGGRLGMEREWRGNADISGGGEMLDQGVHLIDLSRWFVGEFTQVTGHVATFFWDWSVEDNGFAMLRTKAGQVAWLHASCTEWKNTFSMEIYGRVGKIHIEGLGGSYGVEPLTLHKMLPEMGPPQTTIWEYPGEDQSWQAEFDHFAQCIKTGATPSGSLQDAVAALDVVGKLYAQTA